MYHIDMTPVFHVLNLAVEYTLQGLALAIAGYVTYLIKKYAPAPVEAFLETRAAAALNTALNNGVIVGMHELEDMENLHNNMEVKGKLQQFAVQYAVDHAPGAISKFGLSPEQLAIKALAFIPVPPTTTDTTGNVVLNTPVSVSDLKPIVK